MRVPTCLADSSLVLLYRDEYEMVLTYAYRGLEEAGYNLGLCVVTSAPAVYVMIVSDGDHVGGSIGGVYD